MSNNKLAKLLTDTLPPRWPNLFNPWRERCADCEPCNGPDAKLARLAAHLACNPKFILCGEAAGYLGCRHSGISDESQTHQQGPSLLRTLCHDSLGGTV